MLETFVGWAVLSVSLAAKLIGEPDQIRRNWQRKSTHGISPALYLLACSSHSLWTLHGLIHGDLYLVAAQSVGIFTTGIVLVQMWKYRASSSMETPSD